MLVLLLVTGCCQNNFAQQTAQDVPDRQIETLAQQASTAFATGDYAVAAQKYEELSRLRPNSPEILSNLGVAYHFSGNTAKAIEPLEKALRLAPNMGPTNLLLGIAWIELGQAEKAIAPLTRLLKQDPANRDARLALASAYFAIRNFEKAAETYLAQTRLQNGDTDSWYGLGLSFEHIAEDTARHLGTVAKNSVYYHRLVGDFLLEQDVPLDAEAAYQQALLVADKQHAGGLHGQMGFAHLRLGELSQARAEFQAEEQLEENSPEGQLGMAALAMEEQDFTAAAKILCSIYSTNRSYFGARLSFVLVSLSEEARQNLFRYIQQGNHSTNCPAMIELVQEELTSPESVIAFEEAFKVDGPVILRSIAKQSAPHAVDRLSMKCGGTTYKGPLELAGCLCRSGRFLASFESASAVIDKNSSELSAYYWQAEASRRLAQAAFQNAMRLNPNSWQGHLLLGDLYRQRKNWELSITHYEAAGQIKPQSPAPYLGLATLYWNNGQFEKAEIALQKVLEFDPGNPTASFELGDLYVRLHDFEKAIPYLQRAIGWNSELLAAHADLGKAYAALGSTDQAVTELVRALPMDQYGDIHHQLASLYKKQGFFELAAQALQKGEELRKSQLELEQERLNRVSQGAKEHTSPP